MRFCSPRWVRPAAIIAISIISTSCGSESATVPPPGPPIILRQPVSQTVAPGETATFTVDIDTATEPCTFQWLWSGMQLRGAVRSITTRPAEVTDDGSTFTVVVTNAYGSTTSSASVTGTLTPGNIVGNTIYQSAPPYPGGSGSWCIQFPSSTATGNYKLDVADSDGVHADPPSDPVIIQRC